MSILALAYGTLCVLSGLWDLDTHSAESIGVAGCGVLLIALVKYGII